MKTKTIYKLSELLNTNVFQKVTAKYEGQSDYFFLEDNMKEEAKYLIEEAIENGRLPKFDAKEVADSIRYSLSNCQWDGVSFGEWASDYVVFEWVDGEDEVKYSIVTTPSLYSHSNTFDVYYNTTNYTESVEQSKEFERRAEKYTENLRDICHKLEKFWYACIEEDDKYRSHESVFNKFLEDNNIESCDIFDYSFGDKDWKCIVEVGDMESTNLSTYVEDFEVVRHERKTLNDGEVVKVEYFYTPIL